MRFERARVTEYDLQKKKQKMKKKKQMEKKKIVGTYQYRIPVDRGKLERINCRIMVTWRILFISMYLIISLHTRDTRSDDGDEKKKKNPKKRRKNRQKNITGARVILT